MDLKNETTDQLEYLRSKINDELRSRKQEPTKTCFSVIMDGQKSCATNYKEYEDARQEMFDILEDLTPYKKIELVVIEVPESDFNLRPSQWYGFEGE